MPYRPAIAYRYDGSLDGLFTCLMESYQRKEIPAEIFPPDTEQISLLPCREIETNPAAVKRVQTAIPQKIGPEALRFVQKGFLTCLPRKEWYLLIFLRMGFHFGSSVMTMISHEKLTPLFNAVRNLENESHRMKEFFRFSEHNGTLISRIAPKNQVLPMIAQHFCERFPEEQFLIFDETHHMALVYRPYDFAILPLEELIVPRASEDEFFYRALWKMFYDTIEIPGRRNHKCRMTHMPKRYWKHMTEFEKLYPELKASRNGAEGLPTAEATNMPSLLP